jgi:hypothetical protein
MRPATETHERPKTSSAPLLRIATLRALVAGCYASRDPRADVGPVDARAVGPRSGPGEVVCTPGVTVTIGCGARGLGTCSGDPVLFVCDASLSSPDRCSDESSGLLGRNDDSEGLCPAVEVRCPSSGRLAVRARPFGAGSFECRWDSRGR